MIRPARTLAALLFAVALPAAASAGSHVTSPAPPSAAQAGRPTGDSALTPADGAVPGWKKTDPLRVFTRADLYGYIDGGAELFLEFGFDQLTLQKYRNGANEFAVEIYRMTDPVAATGIYLMKRGRETRDASFKERHTINRHQLMFVRAQYYVTINNLTGADKMSGDLVAFGARVTATLPADRVPAELKTLPAAGLVAGSERLVRGPYALQALYTLGDGDILRLGGKLAGVAANYKDAAGTSSTLILVVYPDAAAAKAAFVGLTQNLDKYLKPVSTAPARLVFKDYENTFGVISLNARQIEVRLHLPKAPQ